jgi:hypothetical protein
MQRLLSTKAPSTEPLSQLGGRRVLSCVSCRTHVADEDSIISKARLLACRQSRRAGARRVVADKAPAFLCSGLHRASRARVPRQRRGERSPWRTGGTRFAHRPAHGERHKLQIVCEQTGMAVRQRRCTQPALQRRLLHSGEELRVLGVLASVKSLKLPPWSIFSSSVPLNVTSRKAAPRPVTSTTRLRFVLRG